MPERRFDIALSAAQALSRCCLAVGSLLSRWRASLVLQYLFSCPLRSRMCAQARYASRKAP